MAKNNPLAANQAEKATPSKRPVDDNIDNSSDDGDDGVDEAGMKRLMELLGDDGLDELGAAQLKILAESGIDNDESDAGDDDASGNGDDPGGPRSDESGENGEDEDGIRTGSEDEREEDASHNEDGEKEEFVALDDASSVDEDAVPRQKIVINNTVALQRIRETIKLDPSFTWTDTLALTYPDPLGVDDPDNDLERELAFYKQALHAANAARALAAKHSLPFTRPPDYFAEMVKSDAHMERIRQKLLDETAGIKKGEEARKQRELKKFGKQVQVEKLKERVKGKKEMEERLKGLKRKRGKSGLDDPQDDEAFDIAVEDAIADRPSSSNRGSAKRPKLDSDSREKKRMPRSARDAKFGFGSGGKRRDKQNTKESTNDFGGGGGGGSGGRGPVEIRVGEAERLGSEAAEEVGR
ncbi:hypothetical protein BS47DRAFT_1340762 [Hydnum rufescens UP504]|uniref:Ebp2-domain-containing protein n=1 Tax=Hydnum rufescens UP504 TaxID=1448309 RepID=A0A9P6B303_9AGAM|nr:hypothetical protein BS47DRAFT_1340762 [Hydnum rufescens UP504]